MLGALSAPAQPSAQVPPTTEYSRTLLPAGNAATARAVLKLDTAPFTVMQLPDMQLSGGNLTLLTNMFDWILAHGAANNLKALVLPGDLVNYGNSPLVWPLVSQLERVQAAGILVAASPGNHESWSNWPPSYIHGDNFWNMNMGPLIAASTNLAELRAPGDYTSCVWTQTVGNYKLAYISVNPYGTNNAFHLERMTNAANWAVQAAARYPDYRVIWLSHGLLNSLGNPSSAKDRYYFGGDVTWNILKAAPNAIQVMSGHWATNGWTNAILTGTSGNAVQGLLFNMHFFQTNVYDGPWNDGTNYFGFEFAREMRWVPGYHTIAGTTWNTRSNSVLTNAGATFTLPDPFYSGGTVSNTNFADAATYANEIGRNPVPQATGTAFFITAAGHLLTAAHVVEKASRIQISVAGKTYPASLVKADTANDVAVLKVEGTFKALALAASRSVKLGDTVFTVGFPNTDVQGTVPKLTKGEISSLTGIQDDPRHFQISAPVQPGSSGSPLVDRAGNVVGLVTARRGDLATLRLTGSLPQNVNYALQSSFITAFLETLPEVAANLKAPRPAHKRPLSELVGAAQPSVALVLAVHP